MDTLLNLSGGIDSTYCMYHYLKNNPNKTLLVHHIDLVSPEARLRHIHELNAVTKILKWMNKNGCTNYEYLQSKVDYQAFNYTCVDVNVVLFMSGILLQSPKRTNITRIIMPNHYEDFQRRDYENRSLSRFKIFEAMVSREIEFLYPIKEMTKKDLREATPKFLYNLTWYCRRPLKDGKPCGKCRTCIDVNKEYLLPKGVND